MKVNFNQSFLRNMALQQVEEVQKEYPNEIICLYYSKELTEYTVVPKSNVSALLVEEPNLELVAEYKNGTKL